MLEREGECGFNVVVPAFPDIHTSGHDCDDALAMARNATELVLAYYRDERRAVPPST